MIKKKKPDYLIAVSNFVCIPHIKFLLSKISKNLSLEEKEKKEEKEEKEQKKEKGEKKKKKREEGEREGRGEDRERG